MKRRGKRRAKEGEEGKKRGWLTWPKERVGGTEETKPRGSLVRLCEIKTRFTGSFYCGLDVFFVSLSLHATVPFNRFNEYIVYQWSLREYRVSLFPNNFYLLLSASLALLFSLRYASLNSCRCFFPLLPTAVSPLRSVSRAKRRS